MFTIGNVKIDLVETFDPEEATDIVPGRDVEKLVNVENVGTNDAYVRVHIAIPTNLDDGDPSFNAANNFLHWNFSKESIADGEWSWLPEYSEGVGYKGNGAGNWNFYQMTMDGVDYNVYVATYRTALASGETTATDAIHNVYLDTTVDCEVHDDGTVTYSDNKGNSITMGIEDTFNIEVFAEAVQAEGFENAYEALNTIGEIGTYCPWETGAVK